MTTRYCYLAGALAPLVFLLSVIVGGARRTDYSHRVDPVSALGMSGAADAGTINGAWAATGLLIMFLGIALWRDSKGPGRLAAGAVLLAGAASAAIALWFPMDPPGVPLSVAQQGHNILVGVAALCFAAALLAAARAPAAPPAYRRLTWIALVAMLAGGVGAALSGAFGWERSVRAHHPGRLPRLDADDGRNRAVARMAQGLRTPIVCAAI